MAWDNNPGGPKESLPDLSEIIKKVGDSLSLGKGGTGQLPTGANDLIQLIRRKIIVGNNITT